MKRNEKLFAIFDGSVIHFDVSFMGAGIMNLRNFWQTFERITGTKHV